MSLIKNICDIKKDAVECVCMCVGEGDRKTETDISVIINLTLFSFLNINRKLNTIWLKIIVTGKALYTY